MMEVAQNQDQLTEQLIARLLEDDLKDFDNARAAESLQMSEALRISAHASGRFPRIIKSIDLGMSDEDLAREALAAEILASKDALIAQRLQHAEESEVTASRQYAQKLAAAEKKCALDAAFARRLQEALDNGSEDIGMQDAESVLGHHVIENILVIALLAEGRSPLVLIVNVQASDLNDKGKGKGKGSISMKMDVDDDSIPPPSYMETTWPEGIPDYIAERVLSDQAMVLWALPLDDRSPEDQEALRLMKAENWRRCPNCSYIVELTHGCNHITCRCKTEFCFRCGALWDVQRKLCSREPSCDLWDENMLLEERERERERAAPPPRDPVLPNVGFLPDLGRLLAAPQPRVHRRQAASLDWMDDPDILCTRHWFTRDMIKSLTCLYCDAKLTSLADLRYHLTHVRRHAVYACCGRFFKREEDYDRHLEAEALRFGDHVYTFQRN
ncbi:hypothetical protein BN946_scf184921.g21 [Trametes cinnabarina]|uniref:IBR domain-containing protein n=1 Tax=Pycnoporus cinnabarinus TaxID=5643 RepID=A0A060SMY1_PYCCI|nr:hypothetical protein BN946_scf184921.g21 [Trametes cinnabarina]